jgi:hypothetical protein
MEGPPVRDERQSRSVDGDSGEVEYVGRVGVIEVELDGPVPFLVGVDLDRSAERVEEVFERAEVLLGE